jgi:hypothetical protein
MLVSIWGQNAEQKGRIQALKACRHSGKDSITLYFTIAENEEEWKQGSGKIQSCLREAYQDLNFTH